MILRLRNFLQSFKTCPNFNIRNTCTAAVALNIPPDAPFTSISHPITENTILKKSYLFQLSMKYLFPYALIFSRNSIVKRPVKMRFIVRKLDSQAFDMVADQAARKTVLAVIRSNVVMEK
jgi:hypothetical protein